MVDKGQNFGLEQWIIDLAAIAGETERRAFLAGRGLCTAITASVDSLYNAVVIFARVDLQKADRMAQASSWIAAQINDPAIQRRKAPVPWAMFYT